MYPFWIDIQSTGVLQFLPAVLAAVALLTTRLFGGAA